MVRAVEATAVPALREADVQPEEGAARVGAGRHVHERSTPDATPQLQNVTRMPCGLVAFASPAIIRRLFGNVLTPASVPRR